jgi:thioredoxin-related protein
MIPREQPQEGLRLIVLERNQCVYCRELKETIIPRLQSEFGDRVTIVYHSADDFPGVTKTPTLILMRNQEAQVFEGLPPYEMLRKAVRAKLEGSP